MQTVAYQVMLLRHNITGTEAARSASIMHSNPAKLNPVCTVLQGRRVANTSPALCSNAAWVKFCLNCSMVDKSSLGPARYKDSSQEYTKTLTCACTEASGAANMHEISCLQSLTEYCCTHYKLARCCWVLKVLLEVLLKHRIAQRWCLNTAKLWSNL